MRLISAALAAALMAGPVGAQTAPAGPVLPQGAALTDVIKARDAEFFALFFTGNYSHLGGDFRDSPIVDDRGSASQWLGAVGLGYTF